MYSLGKQAGWRGLLALALVCLGFAGMAQAQIKKVVLAGTIQGALGASSWNPDGDITKMDDTGKGIYEFVAAFPKGKYEYKVAINGSWDENYGAKGEKGGGNIGLSVEKDAAVVKFVFNYNDKSIMDSVNNADKIKAPAIAPVKVAATPPPPAEGNSRLIFHYKRLDGKYDGWNIWSWANKPKGLDGAAYKFSADDEWGKVATIDIAGKHTQFGFIVRKGDWEAKDGDEDRFAELAANGVGEVWVLQGIKEVAANLNDAKKLAAANIKAPAAPAFLDASDRIRVFVDDAVDAKTIASKIKLTWNNTALAVKEVKAAGPAISANQDSIDPKKVALPGTIQAALGGNEWNPNGDITRMTEVSANIFEFVAAFPKGQYEFKVARGGSWDENYGVGGEPNGPNFGLVVPADGTIVKFVFDYNKKLLKDSINNPKEVQAPSSVPPKAAVAVATGPELVQQLDLMLGKKLTIDEITKPIKLMVGDVEYVVYARNVLSEARYLYNGTDLGPSYTRTATKFKVWSPVSETAELLLFDGPVGPPDQVIDMQRDATGTWGTEVKGNWHGKYYQYRFRSYGQGRVAADIYAYSASEDGTRSQVVDLARTNPSNWARDKSPKLAKPTDAVIYEIHTRDFTIDPSSGVPEKLRGTYLGLAQRGTLLPGTNQPTGLDHLAKLGITDIHLLPIQKFNPFNSSTYNWGYETTLFNVPDARYSSKPNDGIQTIKDVKTMVQGIHSAGMRLVLDVVYNHTVPAKGELSAFDQTVPFFYFRTNDSGRYLNESGVGNAVNDEQLMVRKYIRDSLVYWLREYKIDGYRFDLVGMFTADTVRDLMNAVRKVRPDALLYGEPWTGGGPTRFGKGAQRGMSFAVFNDNIRNAMRGDLDGTRKGFAMGGLTAAVSIQRGVVGSIPFNSDIKDFTDSPLETINYASAHDNMALWDKMDKAMPEADQITKARAVKLSGAIVLTAQGIPFLEGGVEIGRTKGGNPNSYNAGDAVNKFDWTRMVKFSDANSYYSGLIAVRRAHPMFRMDKADDVRKAISFLPASDASTAVVAFTIDGAVSKDSWKKAVVIYNGNNAAGEIKLPAGTWNIAVTGDKAGIMSLGTASGTLKLDPLSAYVLYQ
jgi:pullulanase